VQNEQTKRDYFEALKSEILSFDLNKITQVSILNSPFSIKTIYFGGGTPSSVDQKCIEEILKTIENKFKVDKNAEITIECNPNSTDESKLSFYKKIGINRLSFGVQSFNKHLLEFVGRIQNNKQLLKDYQKNTIEILKNARKIGFNNISADFILGLPYQTNFELKRFIKKLCKLVCHFSCYMLTLEEGTKLFNLMPQGVDEEKIAKQYEIATKLLKKLGFERYEVSNFAKPGFESKHNKNYWDMGEYVGFGLAAHSFYNNQRLANTEKLKDYINFYTGLPRYARNNKRSEISPRTSFGRNDKNNVIPTAVEGSQPINTTESLTKEQLAEETIMLALRTREGLDLVKFKANFYDLEQNKKNEIARLINSGFIEFENNYIRLAPKGFLVSNKIILELVS
jgi:oxygen-independent coproporphyrinogen-3 oxidase